MFTYKAKESVAHVCVCLRAHVHLYACLTYACVSLICFIKVIRTEGTIIDDWKTVEIKQEKSGALLHQHDKRQI